uniref:DUF7487 domain-containing protein n=1 Tax=viral metagenome TaxID=1070528 RepID=A0A6C0JW51_9ZZZZ
MQYQIYLNNKKDWIEANCFTKKGRSGLNNRVCLESWWINKNIKEIYDDILASTQHLSKDCLFSERIYHIINGLSTIPICKTCQSNTVNFNTFNDGYYDYCSKYCSTQSDERNLKIKTNNDYSKLQEKLKESNLKKYGVEYYFQTQESVGKIKKTKLDRYGNEKYNNIDKAKQTNLEKYGYEHTCLVPEIKEKIQNANDEILKSKNEKAYYALRNKEWLKEQNKTKTITDIAKDLQVTYRAVYLWFKQHNIEINFFSTKFGKQQKEIQDFISSLGIPNLKINDRTIIKPKEIDIYLPDYNLGIEFNGMYFHAEDENRHLIKYNLCKDQNIKLLQIWDTEWLQKQDIIKSIIKSNLKLNERIYARKCEIIPLNSNTYKEFLEYNHIQGNVNSSIRYGLTYNKQLVAVIGFGKSRFDKKYSHELLRYCNLINTNIIGGFSKLLKHAVKNHNITSIQTFCDLRLFDGTSYEKSGFQYSHQSKPGYVYYKSGLIKNRQEFQKHKLKNIFDNFDDTLTEEENCFNNDWIRIFDCGQKVYFINL